MEKKRSAGVIISCIMLVVSFFDSAAAADNNINAATVYKEAYSMLTNLPKDFTSEEYIQELIKIINDGWKNDNKELKEILISNQVALNEFKKATKLQNCDFTFGKQIKMTATTPVPQFSFGEPISLVRLVLVEARLYEKENKWDLALDNYISVLRFTHHLNQQENFILLSRIVETITQNLVYAPLAHYATREDLNSQQCQILFDTLLFMKRNRIGLEKAFEYENEGTKNTFRTMGEEAKQKGKYKESYYQALYNEFDRLQDEFTEYLILAYKENKPEIYKEKVDEFNADLEKAKKPINLAWESIKGMMGLHNKIPVLVAKISVSLGLGQFSKLITRYYISISKFDILSTAVAIKLYEINNGKTPDSLEELIPSYFKDLPGDPFNNFNPLKYEKRGEGWVIYSFGPDKQDNQAKIIHSGKIEDIEKQGDICLISPASR